MTLLDWDCPVLSPESPNSVSNLPSISCKCSSGRLATATCGSTVLGYTPPPGLSPAGTAASIIPTGAKEKKTQPDDVYAAVKAAFEGGAHGVLLSRKYSEMTLANLRAAGRAVRDLKMV